MTLGLDERADPSARPHATFRTSTGEPYPLGATVAPGGVNFSLFSQHATAVELLLFHRFDDPEPFQIVRIHPHLNKTFHYWHVLVEGIGGGQIYAYRVDGPDAPAQGDRFNARKVLIDPYSRGVVYGRNWSRDQACRPDDNCRSAMKSLVVDAAVYDWEGAQSPNYHPANSIIYELHVRGFTRHPSSRVTSPGTFDGLVEKIPYLLDLGVTTVELLPIHQFDPTENPLVNPETGEKLTNFWGYNSICYFAPHRGYYTADWERMEYLTGFRDMVRAMHKAGLEVILDVVFNHTSEGDERGPTICFRGFENSVYYLLDAGDKSRYLDYSGCGNTVNCNHPLVRRMILDSLRYWVSVMRVDGFRFDLASILGRDERGRPMQNPPLLWEIESDPVLQKTKIIAEAWDAAGLYQVGGFPGERWAEWNGRYRDDVRRFVRGDEGMAGIVASRMTGSADLYQHLAREPYQSVNFITCHDGFTLSDLVSYNGKHNLANGEGGRYGAEANLSFNYGAEGPADPETEALRKRQIKNFIAVLFLSQGIPMLLAGDEFRRTQRGNNNAYCQDNGISWVDWSLLEREKDLFRFTKLMIRFRKAHPILRRCSYSWGEKNELGWSEITWHGVKVGEPDWSFCSHSLAFTLAGFDRDNDIHVMINMWTSDLDFALPGLPSGKAWFRCVDTSAIPPADLLEEGSERRVECGMYHVSERSLAVLISQRESLLPA
ncbi:MAG: glycogen debranching protein GlgX [Candidatus Rokubacteria bacterium]|nr:glycogen debranching protein GlgX [Candidatus Rokubacteria bacterium]